MKVLLVHVWLWPHIGGGNRHVELLGRELVSKGHEVTVWCADVPEHHEKTFKRFGMNVVRIPPSFVISGIDPMVSLSGLDPGEFDIVHLHDTLPILLLESRERSNSIMGTPLIGFMTLLGKRVEPIRACTKATTFIEKTKEMD